MPKRDATTTPGTDTERIAALESKVSQLQSKIASLPEPNSTDYSSEIEGLYDSIDALQTEIDDVLVEVDDVLVEVDDMLTSWEEEQEANPSSSDGEAVTTRWAPTASFSLPTTGLTIKNILWRGSIRDEDTYTLTLDIENSTGSNQVNRVLIISFDPSNDDTSIDTANTGVYPNPIHDYLTLWGETEFRPSNGENCRNIEFYSDPFTVPGVPVVPGDSVISKVSLSFDLYYAE